MRASYQVGPRFLNIYKYTKIVYNICNTNIHMMFSTHGTVHPVHRRIVLLLIAAVALAVALAIAVQSKVLLGAIARYRAASVIEHTDLTDAGTVILHVR